MTRSAILQTIALLVALAAAFISFSLLAKHLSGTSGAAWFEAGCGPGMEGSSVSCDAVLASPYAYLPFKREGEPPNTPHIPVAFMGLVYYSAIVVWMIGVGRPSYTRRWVHLLPLGVVAGGLAGSAIFTYIMFTKVDEWCPWCLVTHILNVFLAVLLVIMWPRTPEAQRFDQASATPEPDTETEALQATRASAVAGVVAASAPPHPSARLVLATVLGMCLLAFGQREMLGHAQARLEGATAADSFKACVAAIDQLKADTSRFVRYWQLGDEHQIPVRPDDPIRTHKSNIAAGLKGVPSAPQVQVVVFSDFECPSCRRLAVFMREQVEPLFGGSLSTVFKHYPLNSDCNPRTTTRKHEHACEAARIAEAARTIGGNDAFWQAHDYLFENQAELKRGRIEPETVAEDLGLELESFRKAMASDETTARIAEDSDLARRCGVISTPAVFIDGKMVDGLAVREIGFWEKVAGIYRQRGMVVQPTPGSPDP